MSDELVHFLERYSKQLEEENGRLREQVEALYRELETSRFVVSDKLPRDKGGTRP